VNGLSGVIKFDKFGLRKDYKLEVLEISQNRGLSKASVSFARSVVKSNKNQNFISGNTAHRKRKADRNRQKHTQKHK